MHVVSDTWLILLRKGEKNPLCGGSGATPVLPPIKGVLARLVSPALVLSLCPVLQRPTCAVLGYRRKKVLKADEILLPSLFPVISGIPCSRPLSHEVPEEHNAGAACGSQRGFWIWGNVQVWRERGGGSPSPSFEVPPLLLSPLRRPCCRLKVSQDKVPSWPSSTMMLFNLSITKGLNGISHRCLVIWTQGTCRNFFAVVDPKIKRWV